MGGTVTSLLVYCSIRLGPLLHPCLCCRNHWPADTHPLGLKYVLSKCCRNYYQQPTVGRINHWQVSCLTHRCSWCAAALWALHGSPHSLLSYYWQICLVTVPLAALGQLKLCCTARGTRSLASNLWGWGCIKVRTCSNAGHFCGTCKHLNNVSRQKHAFYEQGGGGLFGYIHILILPKRCYILEQISTAASKTLKINVKIYSQQERQIIC